MGIIHSVPVPGWEPDDSAEISSKRGSVITLES